MAAMVEAGLTHRTVRIDRIAGAVG